MRLLKKTSLHIWFVEFWLEFWLHIRSWFLLHHYLLKLPREFLLQFRHLSGHKLRLVLFFLVGCVELLFECRFIERNRVLFGRNEFLLELRLQLIRIKLSLYLHWLGSFFLRLDHLFKTLSFLFLACVIAEWIKLQLARFRLAAEIIILDVGLFFFECFFKSIVAASQCIESILIEVLEFLLELLQSLLVVNSVEPVGNHIGLRGNSFFKYRRRERGEPRSARGSGKFARIGYKFVF